MSKGKLNYRKFEWLKAILPLKYVSELDILAVADFLQKPYKGVDNVNRHRNCPEHENAAD